MEKYPGVSLVNMVSDIVPLSVCWTPLSPAGSPRSCAVSHRSALSLTAHSLCRGLGDAGTAPLQGRDPRVPVRPRPGQLPLAPAAPRQSPELLESPGCSRLAARKVGFHQGIQRNGSPRAPQRDTKLKATRFKNEIL